MLLHGVKDTEFEIHHGDSLLNDWDMLNQMNPSKKMEFDAIVANPPFSYRWEPTEVLGEDFHLKAMVLHRNLLQTLLFYYMVFTFWVKKVRWQLFYHMAYYSEEEQNKKLEPSC